MNAVDLNEVKNFYNATPEILYKNHFFKYSILFIKKQIVFVNVNRYISKIPTKGNKCYLKK